MQHINFDIILIASFNVVSVVVVVVLVVVVVCAVARQRDGPWSL